MILLSEVYSEPNRRSKLNLFHHDFFLTIQGAGLRPPESRHISGTRCLAYLNKRTICVLRKFCIKRVSVTHAYPHMPNMYTHTYTCPTYPHIPTHEPHIHIYPHMPHIPTLALHIHTYSHIPYIYIHTYTHTQIHLISTHILYTHVHTHTHITPPQSPAHTVST